MHDTQVEYSTRLRGQRGVLWIRVAVQESVAVREDDDDTLRSGSDHTPAAPACAVSGGTSAYGVNLARLQDE